jgi:hypothetical protein
MSGETNMLPGIPDRPLHEAERARRQGPRRVRMRVCPNPKRAEEEALKVVMIYIT